MIFSPYQFLILSASWPLIFTMIFYQISYLVEPKKIICFFKQQFKCHIHISNLAINYQYKHLSVKCQPSPTVLSMYIIYKIWYWDQIVPKAFDFKTRFFFQNRSWLHRSKILEDSGRKGIHISKEELNPYQNIMGTHEEDIEVSQFNGGCRYICVIWHLWPYNETNQIRLCRGISL